MWFMATMLLDSTDTEYFHNPRKLYRVALHTGVGKSRYTVVIQISNTVINNNE